MKQKAFLFAAILMALIIPQTASAYDFSAVAPTGQTLYYNISDNSNHRVYVCTPNPGVRYISGALSIPDSVENNGIKYAVTSIGWYAFGFCDQMTSVTIPNTVTSIEDIAFSHCSGLTSVTIPNSVTSIGNQAFMECSNLTSITIPNSVSSIGQQAFQICSNLTSVTIPNSITSIGYATFSQCRHLTSVNIPNSVTYIGTCAFEECNNLTSMTIPNSVYRIEERAFYKCNSLMSLTIPSSVNYIGPQAFSGCSGLSSIVVENGNTQFDSRDSCNAIIKTTSNSIIQGCKNTVIPHTVTTVGARAFSGCSSLTSITFPDSVVGIGSYAFSGCSGLTSVTIPSTIVYIDDHAFANCNNLMSVYCLRVNPPLVGDNLFFQSYSVQIYVPCVSVSNYQNEVGWRLYSSNIQGTPFLDYIYSFEPNNDTMGSVSVGVMDCDSNVSITATAHEGYRFSHWSDGNNENPRTLTVTSDTIVIAYFESTTQSIQDVCEGKITVYPNPTSGRVQVEADDVTRIDVYSINGQLVKSVSGNNVVNITTLSSGTYIMKVATLKASFVCKVIKK